MKTSLIIGMILALVLIQFSYWGGYLVNENNYLAFLLVIPSAIGISIVSITAVRHWMDE